MILQAYIMLPAPVILTKRTPAIFLNEINADRLPSVQARAAGVDPNAKRAAGKLPRAFEVGDFKRPVVGATLVVARFAHRVPVTDR
jgi:hypothetical protein